MFRLGALVTVTNMNPSGNLSFMKKNFCWVHVLDLNPEGWNRFDWTSLRRGGGSCWLRAYMIEEASRTPSSMISWHLLYNWGETWKNSSQGNRLVLDTYLLRRLGRLFAGSLNWPAEHVLVCQCDFTKTLVGTSALKVVELRCSPHRLIRVKAQSEIGCGRQKLTLIWATFKDSARASRTAQYVAITNTNLLTLVKEITPDYT
jgi:hypothetical protein